MMLTTMCVSMPWRHGKHVVCEKPVTLSSASLQEMIDESNRNHVIFTVHQNRRWDEDFLIMKKIYDEGTLARYLISNPVYMVPAGFPVTGAIRKNMAAAWCWIGASHLLIRSCR